MARPLRIQCPGALYHLTARGNEKRRIFRDEPDRLKFRETLARSCHRYRARLYAYVLMENHYHLPLETPQGDLSRFMHHLNASYTMWFNRRHQHSGHLLGGRFKARVVEGSRYLLVLTRYLHLSPAQMRTVRSLPLAERIGALRQYRWNRFSSGGMLHFC